jgi:glycosyltransferase involved in cell wall biosynthesis
MSLNIIHVFRAPIGGLFRHVVDLARGQIARGHKVGMIADSSTGNARADEIFAELAPRLKLGLTRIPMRRPLSPLDLPAMLHVTERIRESSADVIHGHGAKGGAYARLAMPGYRIVRAYTPHGGSLLLHDNWSGRMHLMLERMLLMRPAVLLFESAYSARMFRERVGEPNGFARVIHNGVSDAEFEPVECAPAATDLCFIGEFRAVKGIDILIDALARLHDAGREVTATLVGSGPDEAALKAQVKRRALEHAVRFQPAMPARRAFTLGRIMVLPSRAESLPYAVLEAAAAGKPLITTNVGGIPEIFGPLSPALIPAGDPNALAGAIARSLDNPEAAASFAEDLRQRVATSFSVNVMVDGVIAAYREAIDDTIAVQDAALAAE